MNDVTCPYCIEDGQKNEVEKIDYKEFYSLMTKQYARDIDDCIEALLMAKELIHADLIESPQEHTREYVLDRINAVKVLDL